MRKIIPYLCLVLFLMLPSFAYSQTATVTFWHPHPAPYGQYMKYPHLDGDEVPIEVYIGRSFVEPYQGPIVIDMDDFDANRIVQRVGWMEGVVGWLTGQVDNTTPTTMFIVDFERVPSDNEISAMFNTSQQGFESRTVYLYRRLHDVLTVMNLIENEIEMAPNNVTISQTLRDKIAGVIVDTQIQLGRLGNIVYSTGLSLNVITGVFDVVNLALLVETVGVDNIPSEVFETIGLGPGQSIESYRDQLYYNWSRISDLSASMATIMSTQGPDFSSGNAGACGPVWWYVLGGQQVLQDLEDNAQSAAGYVWDPSFYTDTSVSAALMVIADRQTGGLSLQSAITVYQMFASINDLKAQIMGANAQNGCIEGLEIPPSRPNQSYLMDPNFIG